MLWGAIFGPVESMSVLLSETIISALSESIKLPVTGCIQQPFDWLQLEL